MALPLVLAGPILRRVEPRLVSVWVALSARRIVRLRVWQGLQSATTTQAPLGEPEETYTDTLRIGENLHIALALQTFPEPQAPLLPDQLYSYDIGLVDPAPGGTYTNLLDSALLQDGMVHGRPHLALGYGANQLPSFALPPQRLEDLRLFQGSCRRLHEQDVDALAFVDDFIAAEYQSATRRPHQLFLTGDQIYADEVATSLLPDLTKLGVALIGNHPGADEEPIAHERLPVLGADYPADQVHFPTGRRQVLVRGEARLSTTGGHSHLLSLGEYCAMYLFAWSNVVWPDTLSSLATTLDGPPSPLDIHRVLTAADAEVLQQEMRQHFDEERRRASQTALLFTMTESPTLALSAIREALDREEVTQDLRAQFLAPSLGTAVTVSVDIAEYQWRLADHKQQQVYVLERQVDASIAVYRWSKTLAKVRRLLANVPTYMSPDDHEITDDWNFRQEWRDRVYSNPLGRAVVRNGLVAYALFQGWGSDPQRFATGANKELLDKAQELFPVGSSSGPDATVAARIDTLLGLDGGTPPVRWDFTVPGTRHQVFVLDCRTRRTYPSRFAPPVLLSDEAFDEQLPKIPPLGVDVFFVVSSLPILGPPIVEELIQPLSVRAFDVIKHAFKPLDETSRLLAETDPDMESWAFAPEALEKVFARLTDYQRVIILSGDVHFASGQDLSYWKNESGTPARFVQFTSSALKILLPPYIWEFFRRFSIGVRLQRLLDPVERLAWQQAEPQPIRLPQGLPVAPALRTRMYREPVLLGNHAWPPGTCTTRPPDWSWRLRVLADQRPDAERPEAIRPADFGADVDPASAPDRSAALQDYRRVVRRHVDAIGQMEFARKGLFATNIGEVTLHPGAHYQVNAATLQALEEAAVPETVLEALRPLADRPPENQRDFTALLRGVLTPSLLATHQASILQATEVGTLLARHALYAEHPARPNDPQPYLVHSALLETPRELPPLLGDGPCPAL